MPRDPHPDPDDEPTTEDAAPTAGDAAPSTGETEPPTIPYRTDDFTHEAPDGTSLAVRVFRPEGGSDLPVLLQRTPYGRPDGPEGLGVAAPALDAGYAVAYEDTRGRGDSGGEFLPWVHEAGDGAATVEWLADRPWSSGSVGTYGGSSPGQVQLFLAEARPEGLAAIAPMFSPSDLHRADFFQDGAMSAMTFLTWSLGDAVAGHTVDRLRREGRLDDETAEAVRDALGDALDRLKATACDRPLASLPERVLADVGLPDGLTPGDVVPHWEAWTSRPTYDEFWRSFDPEPDYDRIDVPGLHVTGWYELCQQGTLANFRGLRERSPAPQHLVVGPWAHQDTGGELGGLDFGDHASADAYGVWETHLAFFDTYVRDEPRAPFDADGRLVDTLRTTVRDGCGGSRWTRHDDWPPRDARRERWHLGSSGAAATDPDDGRLSRTPGDKFEPADSWVHDPADPVPTRGGPLCCGDVDAGPRDQREIERRDDVCTYTTPAFAAPVELAGPVRATLTVATTAPDTDFTAKLVHVAGDGPAYNLCEGVRRARYRNGRDREDPAPDGPFAVTIDMWDAHHRVPAGDRLRLEVASSNFPRFDAHPGTADPWRATAADERRAEQTLYHERDRESVLELTVR
ncbi:MAG: CocE/NonD family hydrolase [Haloferacaceae archaeon]